jgi:hypothetical protein
MAKQEVYRFLLETPIELWKRLRRFVAASNVAIAERNKATGCKEKKLYFSGVINAAVEKWLNDNEVY